MEDKYNLNRFIEAQKTKYEVALRELMNGEKTNCWMWYVFPQISGLGNSEKTIRYSIKSIDEAIEYINHEVLGQRLMECTKVVLNLENRTARQIFKSIDEEKFRSSLTLFDSVLKGENIFKEALDKYFDGEKDQKTIKILMENKV